MRSLYLRASSFTIILSLFVFAQCNPDESGLMDGTNSYKEIKPDNSIVAQGEIVAVKLNGFDLKEAQYKGKFEKTEIILSKLDESTLVFMVPVSATGKNKLDVESLKFFSNYDVKETVLPSTVNETINNLNSSLDLAVSEIPTDQSTEISKSLDVYKKALEQSTDQQKKELAFIYEANKEIITLLLNGPDKVNTGGRNKRVNDFWNKICDPAWSPELCAFKRSVYILGAGVVVTVAGVVSGPTLLTFFEDFDINIFKQINSGYEDTRKYEYEQNHHH